MRMKNRIKHVLQLTFIITGLCVWYACEREHEATELRAYADRSNALIKEHFGASYDLAPVRFLWARYSVWYASTETITINESLKDYPAAIQRHMDHEVFHAVSGLKDGAPDLWNGVRISDWIAWE